MGVSAEKEWFYMSLGHRRGPVSFEDFCTKIAKEEVFIDSTQVWKLGMKEWVELADAKAFKSAIKKIHAGASQSAAKAKVEGPGAAAGVDEEIVCRGISRALFNVYFYVGWVAPIALTVAVINEVQVLQWVSAELVKTHLFFKLLPFVILALTTWQMAASRMKHAGYSKAHGLGVFVPLFNLWVLLICLLTPRNYGRVKKLGAGGLVYTLVLGGVVAASTLYFVPEMRAQKWQALEVVEGMSSFYKEKTGFTERFKENADEAAKSKARQEQMEQQRKNEREQQKGRLRKQ